MLKTNNGYKKDHANIRRLALNGLFIAIAFVLSALERWIPITAVIPIPGVKLGLANIVTLMLLFYASWKDAFMVNIVRSFLTAFLFGSMASLIFSLAGAFVAIPAMMLAKTVYGRWFSVIGVSILGAVGHNLGQLLAAALTMRSFAVFAYLPVLLGSAILMGTLTALVASPFLVRIKRLDIPKENVAVEE